MDIAVVGAGFAGLATTYFLTQAGARVTLYDGAGLGGGASGVSAGLVHPYVGQAGKPTEESLLGFAETQKLLEIAKCPTQKGIDHQKYGFFIPEGLVIDPELYLKGLLRACPDTRFLQENFKDQEHDLVILCTGSEAPGVHRIKGQVLELDAPPPEVNTIGEKYTVGFRGRCLMGATYERHFTSTEPDIEVAREKIKPHAPILECRAGVRASAPGHFPPITKQIGPKTWVYAGLGSKGLLYHALFAKRLVQSLGLKK